MRADSAIKPVNPHAPFEESVVALIDSLPWPVILIQESGKIFYVNALMKEAGAEKESPNGRDFRSVFPEYSSALNGKVPWLTQQTGNVLRALPNGEQRYEQIWLCKIPKGAYLIIIDKTEHRQLEEGNAQTMRLASLGFMLASVSHEVSNPLTAIHSMVQILQSKRGVSVIALKQGLQNIADSVRRILAITRKLNMFSRMDDEPQSVFSVDIAVEEAIVLFGYDSLGETVPVTHERETQAVVMGFPGQLQQVFFNILLNAAQAMKGRGSICITTHLIRVDSVAISIRDAGPGLHPEHLRKVFEPFFTTKPGGEGTGLGLAISNEIVHEHGGNVWVENHPDGGACFHVHLPLAKQKSAGTP